MRPDCNRGPGAWLSAPTALNEAMSLDCYEKVTICNMTRLAEHRMASAICLLPLIH